MNFIRRLCCRWFGCRVNLTLTVDEHDVETDLVMDCVRCGSRFERHAETPAPPMAN